MSKKMWHKIFKSKSQKQQQQLNKINKRHSRDIYEEQLNELLLNGEKTQALRFCSENGNENENGNGNNCSNNHINVFEQQPPLQSSFNSAAISEAQQLQQQQQSQQLSTFSRVRNTFSLRRNSSNNNNKSSSNNSSNNSNNKPKQTPNAKSSESVTPTTTPTLQHVLIIVNKIDITTAAATAAATVAATTVTTTTNTTTNSANHLPASSISTNMDSGAGDDKNDNEQFSQPPPPLTSGMSIPVPEHGNVDLTPCPICSRKFAMTALRKHAVVCEKMAAKKRKVFDSSRQRREGTSLSTYVLPKNFGLPNAEKAAGLHTPPDVSRESSTVTSGSSQVGPVAPSPVSTRRNPTRASMRKTAGAATPATAAGVSAAAPPAAAAAAAEVSAAPQASATGQRDRSISKRIKAAAGERCPHCERTFNIKAYDRHVEWCKEKAIQATIKSANTNETSKAKERMEARKQYRPPNLKTKRSLNRDKYSQEEQYEAEMVAQKQAQMSLSSMTTSVHSDNFQPINITIPPQITTKVPRSGTPQLPRTTTKPTQNVIGRSFTNEDLNSLSQERVACINPRRKQQPTCLEIDGTVERLRRTATADSLQLTKLSCVDAVPLLPVKPRKVTPRQKLETADNLIAVPQAAMTFEDLNGLIKRKAGTNICKIKMNIDDCDLKMPPKLRSTTSLVRQAHRRIRTRENPSIDLRSLEPPKAISSSDLASKDMLMANDLEQFEPLPAPKQFGKKTKNITTYSGSEDELGSPRGEIRIRLETSTIRTISRPHNRGNLPAIGNSSEPLKALPMSKQKHDRGDLSNKRLPRIDSDDVPKDFYKEENFYDFHGDLDMDDLEIDYEVDKEVEKLLSKAKLLENPFGDDGEHDGQLDDGHDEEDHNENYDELDVDGEQEEQEEKELLKLPALPKQRSNVSRRLVLLEQDEEGTMYIKAPPLPNRRQTRSTDIKRECTLINSGISPLVSDKYDPFLSAKRQLEELCSPNTPPDNEPPTATATPTPKATTSPTTNNATTNNNHNTTTSTTTRTPTTNMSTSLMSTLGKQQTSTTKTTPTSNFRRTSSLRGPRRTPLLPSRPLFATNYRPTIQRGLSDEGPISNNFLKPEEFDEMPVRAACGNDFHSPRVVRRDTSASNRKQQLKLPLGGAAEPMDGTSKQTPRNVAKTDSLAVFLKYEHELEQLNAKAAEVAALTKELSSKELKDKSNNLSKQNSAKNLTINPSSGQLPPLLTTPICPPTPKENIENQAHNFSTPLRLEPISKPMTPQLSTLASNGSSNNGGGGGAPIKLESIFGSNNRGGLGDYIDPKLINPCDNLHVQQSSTGSSSNASSTPQQLPQSRSSSQSTITTGQEQRRHSGDSRNLLKRKMRLGRNQFLYDASPEEAYISSGSCADDEGNRSSLEYDEQCWQQQQKQLLTNPLSMPLTMPNMPQLPTFDDFDFEEFLSSFENENDEEQFPLFRDCREFLLNRATSRHRSFQKATSTTTPITTPTTPQTQSQTPTQILIPTAIPTSTATQRAVATNGKSSQLIISPNTPSTYYTPATNDSHTHRSDSNISSSGGSFKSQPNSSSSYKTPPQSSGSYKSPPHSGGSYKTPMTSSEERIQRQLSNASSHLEHEDNYGDDSHKHSLRHMIGNAQTPIDVLHFENGNEPEHAKFRKISDSEDHFDAELVDEPSRVHYKKRLVSAASPVAKLPMPNVEANNAKNVIEKMRSDFKQFGEEAGASMRRDMMQSQHMQAQHEMKVSSPLTPSPSGDSDELSSLDGYPMSSSQSSRRGASSKLSSDSAYGSSNSPYSLSRQRSGEQPNSAQRSQHQSRPHTASGAPTMSGKLSNAVMDASTQAQCNYGTLKARQRLFAGTFGGGGGGGVGGDGTGDFCAEYSSSSSEHSLPVAVTQQQQLQQQQQQQQQPQHQQNSNFNYQQQQQQSQVQAAYNNNNNNNINNNYEHNAKQNLNNNNISNINSNITPTTSQHSLASNNSSNGSSNMSASMKMSKFCHECGGKFIIEHAKFCMDCGVRRVVL